jgi:hypothetical protein
MKDELRLFDIVSLVVDLPSHDLRRGQVGTIVERLAPGVWEVDFSDDEGQTYATLALRSDQMMRLYFNPVPTVRHVNIEQAVVPA